MQIIMIHLYLFPANCRQSSKYGECQNWNYFPECCFFSLFIMKYIRCSSNWCLYGVHFDDQGPEAVSLWPEFLQWTCQQVLGLCVCAKQSTRARWVSSLPFPPPVPHFVVTHSQYLVKIHKETNNLKVLFCCLHESYNWWVWGLGELPLSFSLSPPCLLLNSYMLCLWRAKLFT